MKSCDKICGKVIIKEDVVKILDNSQILGRLSTSKCEEAEFVLSQ